MRLSVVVLTVLRLTVGALISCLAGRPPLLPVGKFCCHSSKLQGMCLSVCLSAGMTVFLSHCVSLCLHVCMYNICIYNIYAFVCIFIKLRPCDSIFIAIYWCPIGCVTGQDVLKFTCSKSCVSVCLCVVAWLGIARTGLSFRLWT